VSCKQWKNNTFFLLYHRPLGGSTAFCSEISDKWTWVWTSSHGRMLQQLVWVPFHSANTMMRHTMLHVGCAPRAHEQSVLLCLLILTREGPNNMIQQNGNPPPPFSSSNWTPFPNTWAERRTDILVCSFQTIKHIFESVEGKTSINKCYRPAVLYSTNITLLASKRDEFLQQNQIRVFQQNTEETHLHTADFCHVTVCNGTIVNTINFTWTHIH
jgi:hypothetical protein